MALGRSRKPRRTEATKVGRGPVSGAEELLHEPAPAKKGEPMSRHREAHHEDSRDADAVAAPTVGRIVHFVLDGANQLIFDHVEGEHRSAIVVKGGLRP